MWGGAICPLLGDGCVSVIHGMRGIDRVVFQEFRYSGDRENTKVRFPGVELGREEGERRGERRDKD